MNMDLDSKIYKVFDLVYKAVILNICVIIGSLGIITIGASLSATAYITRKLIEGKEFSVFKEFIKSYRSSLKNSVILSSIFLMLFFITSIGEEITALYKLASFYIIILFYIIFYINGNYKMTIKEILTSSFKILNSYIWIVVPFGGILLIAEMIFVRNPLLFILIGAIAILMLINTLIYTLFKKKNIM